MKKLPAVFLFIMMTSAVSSAVISTAVSAACSTPAAPETEASAATPAASALPVKVLLLPKFEIEKMYGDFPGEAQFYYEEYLTGADVYDVPNDAGSSGLYYKDGVALYVLGMGKVNAALGTMAVLSDSRFDFSDAYIISTGCAG